MASCSLIWQRVLAFLLALVLSGATLAVDFTWNSSVALGDFDDPNSWLPSSTAPTVGDTVTFEDSASANFAVDGAVDSITVDQNVGFVFQSDSGVRTLAVDDVFLVDSASLLLDEVRLALSGSVIGMGVEDAKLELLEEARVTGGVIDGVHVLLSDATALLDGIELRNSLVSRTQTVDPSILNNVSIGPNVTLGGNSGTMLQLEGTTTLVGDSELTIAPSLVAILDGQLMGAGDSHLITNFGELWTASLGSLTIGFDDSPGVSQSLTIDNTTGVLNINSLSSFVVDEGELVIQGGLIEGGGNLRADGADLVVSDAAVIDSVSILANNGASLSLGVGVTLQSVDVEVRNGSTSDIPSGFVIGAGSAYRSTNGGVVTIGPAVTNDGSLRAERATLRVVGDTTIDGAGTTTLASAGTLGVAPRIELAGGGSLTVGADQTLLFDTPGEGYLYGTGSGGLTLVNNGLLRVGVIGQATVLQSDNAASPIAAATLQDFTLENRGELLLEGGSRLTLLNDSSTASTPVTTIDNVGGVITLNPGAEFVFDQPNFTSTVVLQGGLITGDGAVRSSGGDLLINGGAVIDGSTIAVENGAALTLDAGVTLQSADIAIGLNSTYALANGLVIDAGTTYRSFGGGELTIGSNVTNNGALEANDATLTVDGLITNNSTISGSGGYLKFLGDSTLAGTGTSDWHDFEIELTGGGSLTIGADQTMQFGGLISAVGTGSTSIVNNGRFEIDQFDNVFIFQNGEDFTFVNNGDLELIGFSSLHLRESDAGAGIMTTIDNRNGNLALDFDSELLIDSSIEDTVLRGGQITAGEFGAGTIKVLGFGGRLRLQDAPTITDVAIEVQNQATLTVDGLITNNSTINVSGGRLVTPTGGEWMGIGQITFSQPASAPAELAVPSGQVLELSSGQQLTFTDGITQLSGGTIAGTSSDGAGSLLVESTGELQVTGNGVTIQDVNFDVQGTLNALADLTTTFALQVKADAELRIGLGATVDAPSVIVDPMASVTLEGGTLNTPDLSLAGSITGSGTIVTPNNPTTPTHITSPITGTSAAEPITLTGWIEGDGLLDNVLFEGTHSPGSGTEFTTAGSLAYGPSADLRIEITNQNVLNPGFDRLVSTGSVVLGGDLDLQLVDYIENTLNINDQLVLLTSSGLSGQFANVAPGDRVLFDGGLASAQIDYGPTSPFNPDHVVFSEFVREPQQIFWIGGNSVWGSPVNWDLLRVPNNDGALIFHAVVNSGNVDVNVPVTLSGLTLNNSGGTLTLNQTMTVEDLTWTAGHLGGPNALTITGESRFETTQQVNTGSGLINQGTATWVDGDLNGTFNQQGFVNEGEFLIELVDDHDFRYVTNTATGVIRHTGTARAWLGGNTGFENDGLVEITGGGTMRVGRDFNNGSDGDFVITDGVLESSIGFGVDHKFNGSITGQEFRSVTGTISFNGAYDIDTTTVSAGSVTFNTAAPATSDTLTISSGELKVETMLFVDDLAWNGGGFATAAGETVLTTSAVIDTSAQKTLSGRFVNQGEAIWRDGDFSQSFVGLFQNEGTLLIELAAERSMYHSFNTSTGVIRHTTSARAIFGPTFGFENDGLVEITGGGKLRVGRDRNNGSDGDFVITDGVLESSIGFGADHKFNGSITGQEFRSVTGTTSFNGTYDVDTTRIDAGVVTLNTTTPATTDTLILTTGDVAVESILTVDQLEWNGGGFAAAAGETVLTTSAVIDTSAQKTLSGRFVNQGEAIWRDGDFSQSFVGLFQNEGTLLIELAAERSMYHSFNTSTGVIRHTTSARAIFGPTFGFENDGLVEITGGGTLRVGRDRNNGSDGDFVITDGVLESSIGFGADHKFNGSITGQEFRASAGTISFNGAYDVDTTSVTNSVVTFNTVPPANTSMLTINSGNIAVETTLEVDQLTWNGGGFVTSGGETVLTTSAVVDTSAGKTLTGRFVNQGEVIWRDGNFSQSSQGLFRNEGTLLIELAAERSLYHLYNTTTGVVRHTSSAVAILGPTAGFENDGLVEITGGGTLRVARDRNNGSDGDFVITNGVLESSVGFGADHKYNGSITGQDFRSVTGTTSFNGAYDVNTTTINGGVVTFNTPSPATTDSLTINAGEVKVETEFAFDEITWTGGGFGNAVGQPILTGQGVISGPTAKAVATTLVNQGELTWNDGNVGSGSVTAARLRNEGLFTMDLVTPRNIVRLENPGGGVIENTGANATINWFANYGTLDVIASTVTVGGNFDNHSGTTLTGGEWIVRDGAAINMGARTVTINNAAVRLFGPGSTLAAIDPLADNRGVFEIAEGRDFTTVGDFTNSGDVVIGQGSTFTVTGTFSQTGNDSSLQVDGEFLSPGGPATFADGAALGGGGFVPGEVVIGTDGVVAPGSSPGTLTVDSLELSNGAIYEWEFDGVEADSVVANQQLTLGTTATLRIVQLGGAPATSDEFVLFAYADTQIDPSNPVWTIDGSLAPDWDTSSATVTINAVDNQILLTGIEIAFNPADFNNDGAVNLVDYTVWRNSLGSTVAPFTFADGDGDGTVSVADYTVWKSNFGTIGVGSSFASSSAVPEPCTVALLIVSCLAASAQRRWFVPRQFEAGRRAIWS